MTQGSDKNLSSVGRRERDKAFDAASYDDVAATFEHFTAQFSLGYARAMAKAAVSVSGDSERPCLLDLGTGSGLLAFEFGSALAGRADAVSSSSSIASARIASVVGVDLSKGMLEQARLKLSQSPLCDVGLEFREMDCENLEFSDGSFDVVGSLFALLHFPSPERALAECFRVLRPGGHLLLAVGSGPRLASLSGLRAGVGAIQATGARALGWRCDAAELLSEVLAQAGHSTGSSQPGADGASAGTTHHLSAAAVPALVSAAGFELVSSLVPEWMGAEERVSDPMDFWRIATTFGTSARKRLAALPEKERTAVRSAFLERSRAVVGRGGQLVYRHGARFTVGRRPMLGRVS